MCLVLVDDDIILYIPVLLNRLYLLFYVTQTCFIWHVSPSPPPPFSVLFRPGESVHLTSSVPGNRSTFFHPLGAITMTTLNNWQRRSWMMSQSTRKKNERSDDGGARRWMMRKTGTVEGRDWIPLGRTQMINKDDFNTTCENSIQLFFFFYASFFLKEQKTKHQKNAQKLCVLWTWMKAIYITLWLKVEIWRHTDTTETLISLCEGWEKKKLKRGSWMAWAREQNCVTITITCYWSSYWALKESSMLFFHTQFTVLAQVQAMNARGIHHVELFNVYTVIEKTLTILKRTMQCVYRCMQCFV